MMSPQNFSVVEPIELVTVTLSPRDEGGLVSDLCGLLSFENLKRSMPLLFV